MNLGLNNRVYKSLRENVPVIDAAVLKIIRLINDFEFETGNDQTDAQMNKFLKVSAWEEIRRVSARSFPPTFRTCSLTAVRQVK